MMTLLSYKINHKQYEKILTVLLSCSLCLDRWEQDVRLSAEREDSLLLLAQMDREQIGAHLP